MSPPGRQRAYGGLHQVVRPAQSGGVPTGSTCTSWKSNISETTIKIEAPAYGTRVLSNIQGQKITFGRYNVSSAALQRIGQWHIGADRRNHSAS